MNYHLFVTGCQQNIYDAEQIAHLLESMGYLQSEEKKADLIIVLACSVRQKPVDRIFGKLKIWKNLPRKPKIIITACLLPNDKKKLKDKVDIIIDSKDISTISTELIKFIKANLLFLRHGVKRVSRGKDKETNIQAMDLKTKLTQYIPIMFGCNNFCSYCAVPYTRGREKSRPIKEILSEVRQLIKSGIKEITLLGQNVNSYRLTKEQRNKRTKKQDFVELLKKIEKIKGLKKISFLTSHPKDMSEELIDWIGKSKKFSRELHLPVQSGDDQILRKMNRHYTADDYIKLVNKLRSAIDAMPAGRQDLRLSTDIIVGFPGETKKQFQNTVELCKKINFAKAYIAQYSPRPGTAAAKLKDDVPKEEKKRRWGILNRMINERG